METWQRLSDKIPCLDMFIAYCLNLSLGSEIKSQFQIKVPLQNPLSPQNGQISLSVQFSHSVVSWLFVTPWTTVWQSSQYIIVSWNLLKLMCIKSVMPSNHLIHCRPLLLLPSIFPSIRVFSNESVLSIRWPKHWRFSFSITPSNEYSGLISFRINWFDLAFQGTLKSLLQHNNSKALILWCSAFCIVQLSHPYMTTGKTIALTRRTFDSNISVFQYVV